MNSRATTNSEATTRSRANPRVTCDFGDGAGDWRDRAQKVSPKAHTVGAGAFGAASCDRKKYPALGADVQSRLGQLGATE
jgi:hypothetical protein